MSTSITERRAEARLKPIYSRLLIAMCSGCDKYLESINAPIHAARTAACEINDLVFAALVNELDDAGITRVDDKKRNMRFLRIDGRPPFLLWVKKVSSLRSGSNLSTKHMDMIQDTGQAAMFPNAEIIVLGFMRNRQTGKLSRVVIAPPCRPKTKPAWYIDLIPQPVTTLRPVAIGEQKRFTVRRSSDEQKLG